MQFFISFHLEDRAVKVEISESKFGKKMAKKLWRPLSPDYIEKLYESMPRILQAVVDAQEGHTKY